MSEDIYDPRERLEIFLNAIRTGDVDDLPDPQTREEIYLAAIATNGSGGLPDTADASVGDALILNGDKEPTWGPPSSGKYLHNILVYGRVSGTAELFGVHLSVILPTTTPITTAASLKDLLISLGASDTGTPFPCSTDLMPAYGSNLKGLFVGTAVKTFNNQITVIGGQGVIDFENSSITWAGTANQYITVNTVSDSVIYI